MVTKIPTKDMPREVWVAARRGSIGGSDAAAVVDLNPYSSPYALWAEKTGALPPEDISEKECVRLGTYLEPYVARRFTEITGKKVRRENYILKNDRYPFAHANVDRLVVGEPAGLECKTTSALNLRRFRGGEYPALYYCQCVHYLAVTGLKKWYLAVLIGNQEVRIFEIERDEDEIAALMDSEKTFWGYVEERKAPPVAHQRATSAALEAMYAGSDGESVDLTPVCADIRQYLALKAQLRALTESLDASANAVKAYMQNAVCGHMDGVRVTWKPYTTARLDKAALHRDHPEIDLGKYETATAARRFEIKEEST